MATFMKKLNYGGSADQISKLMHAHEMQIWNMKQKQRIDDITDRIGDLEKH